MFLIVGVLKQQKVVIAVFRVIVFRVKRKGDFFI